MTDTLQDVLKELDKEYGLSVPDGVYHVRLDEATSKVVESDDRPPSFNIGWKVFCGAHKGRRLSDFLRWITDKPEYEGPSRGHVVQLMKAIMPLLTEGEKMAAAQALASIRSAPSTGGTMEGFGAIAGLLRGKLFYVRATTGKKEFQNIGYLQKGAPITDVCECRTSAVAV